MTFFGFKHFQTTIYDELFEIFVEQERDALLAGNQRSDIRERRSAVDFDEFAGKGGLALSHVRYIGAGYSEADLEAMLDRARKEYSVQAAGTMDFNNEVAPEAYLFFSNQENEIRKAADLIRWTGLNEQTYRSFLEYQQKQLAQGRIRYFSVVVADYESALIPGTETPADGVGKMVLVIPHRGGGDDSQSELPRGQWWNAPGGDYSPVGPGADSGSVMGRLPSRRSDARTVDPSEWWHEINFIPLHDHYRSFRKPVEPAARMFVRQYILPLLEGVEGVVEIGAGPNRIFRSWAGDVPYGWEETDWDPAVVEQMKQSGLGLPLRSKVADLRGPLPYGNGSVPALVSLAALDTVPVPALDGVFSEFARVLKPGAPVVVMLDLRPNLTVEVKQAAREDPNLVLFPSHLQVRPGLVVPTGAMYVRWDEFEKIYPGTPAQRDRDPIWQMILRYKANPEQASFEFEFSHEGREAVKHMAAAILRLSRQHPRIIQKIEDSLADLHMRRLSEAAKQAGFEIHHAGFVDLGMQTFDRSVISGVPADVRIIPHWSGHGTMMGSPSIPPRQVLIDYTAHVFYATKKGETRYIDVAHLPWAGRQISGMFIAAGSAQLAADSQVPDIPTSLASSRELGTSQQLSFKDTLRERDANRPLTSDERKKMRKDREKKRKRRSETRGLHTYHIKFENQGGNLQLSMGARTYKIDAGAFWRLIKNNDRDIDVREIVQGRPQIIRARDFPHYHQMILNAVGLFYLSIPQVSMFPHLAGTVPPFPVTMRFDVDYQDDGIVRIITPEAVNLALSTDIKMMRVFNPLDPRDGQRVELFELIEEQNRQTLLVQATIPLMLEVQGDAQTVETLLLGFNGSFEGILLKILRHMTGRAENRSEAREEKPEEFRPGAGATIKLWLMDAASAQALGFLAQQFEIFMLNGSEAPLELLRQKLETQAHLIVGSVASSFQGKLNLNQNPLVRDVAVVDRSFDIINQLLESLDASILVAFNLENGQKPDLQAALAKLSLSNVIGLTARSLGEVDGSGATLVSWRDFANYQPQHKIEGHTIGNPENVAMIGPDETSPGQSAVNQNFFKVLSQGDIENMNPALNRVLNLVWRTGIGAYTAAAKAKGLPPDEIEKLVMAALLQQLPGLDPGAFRLDSQGDAVLAMNLIHSILVEAVSRAEVRKSA